MMTPEQFAALLEANNAKNNKVLQDQITSGVKIELATFKEELKTEIKDMVQQSLHETNTEISCLKDRILQKDEEIAELKEKTVALEFASKNKNVILFKVLETEGERGSLANGVSKMIRDIADSTFTEGDIDEVYRLGKQPTNPPRPIMLVLKCRSKRTFLLSQKAKFLGKNVGIAEDLPKDVVEWRKPLYKLADSLRKEGKKVVFRLDKMLVDGKVMSREQIAEEEANQDRKRKLSVSPEGSTSTGRRTHPRLNAFETPRSQTNIDQFYSPAPRNEQVFEFVSDDA